MLKSARTRRTWIAVTLALVSIVMALPTSADDLDPITGICIENSDYDPNNPVAHPEHCPLGKPLWIAATGTGPQTISLVWDDNAFAEAGWEVQTTNDPVNGPWVPALKDPVISSRACNGTSCQINIEKPPVNPTAVVPSFIPADPTTHWYRVRATLFAKGATYPVVPGVTLGPLPEGLSGLIHGPWSDADPAFLGPLPPINLAVTVGATNPPSATLTWQNQATGDPTFCDNWVYKSIDVPDFGGTPQEGYGSSTMFVDTNLLFNKTYYYTVRAVRCKAIPLPEEPDHVENGYSNAIPASGTPTEGGGVVIITPPPPPPGAPAGLSILPVCPDRAELLWFDSSLNEDGFLIEWGPTATHFNQQTAIGSRAGTGFVTFLHIGIPPDTTRFYRVKAYRVVTSTGGVQTSQISDPTNAAPVTVAPRAPTNLRTTVNTGAGVTLAWTDQAKTETGYRIERCTVVSGNTCSDFATVGTTGPVGINASGGTGTFTDISVAGNTRYLYRVIPFNASCDATPSTLLDVTTPPAPLIPPVLQSTVGHAHWIQLVWGDAPTNASTGYRIEYKDPGRPWRILEAAVSGTPVACPVGLTGNCIRYDDLSVPGMTTRCHRVRAVKGTQISDPSNEACGTTPAGPKPPAPTHLTGGPWGPCPITSPPSCDPTHAVELHWTDNSEGSLEEDGFIVEHSRDLQSWKVIGQTATDVTVFRYGSFEPASIQYFRVKAFNFEGHSGYSNTVQVKLLGPSRPVWLNPPKTDTVAASSCYVDGQYTLGEGTNDIEVTIVRKLAAETNSYRCTTAPGSCEYTPSSVVGVGDAPSVNQVQLDWNGAGTFRLDFYFRKNVTYELHAKAINNHGASADAPIWSFVVLADCPLGS